VVAFLAPPSDSLGRTLPDLTGLPMREALRQLSLRQVTVHLAGRGLVVRQEPAPGSALPLAGGCRLWCEEPGARSKPRRLEARVGGRRGSEAEEPRLARAQAACAFSDNPSADRRMSVIAVTGTNGKTTTTYMIEAIGRAAGLRCGVIGTTGVRLDGQTRP